MAPSSPFAAQHRPQGRKTVPIRSEGQALGDATFAAFAALAVPMEKLPGVAIQSVSFGPFCFFVFLLLLQVFVISMA